MKIRIKFHPFPSIFFIDVLNFWMKFVLWSKSNLSIFQFKLNHSFIQSFIDFDINKNVNVQKHQYCLKFFFVARLWHITHEKNQNFFNVITFGSVILKSDAIKHFDPVENLRVALKFKTGDSNRMPKKFSFSFYALNLSSHCVDVFVLSIVYYHSKYLFNFAMWIWLSQKNKIQCIL